MDAPVEPRQLLIERAREALRGAGHAPYLADLAGDLFARVPLEDLAPYAPDEIAGFVRLAGGLLEQHKPGVAKIDVSDADFLDSPDVTTVSIVNDNMPFLVDSILAELQDFGAEVLLVAHPIVSVERDGKGKLAAYRGLQPQPRPASRESLFQAHVTALSEAEQQDLAGRLKSLLAEISQAVADWPEMLRRLNDVIAEYRETPPPGSPDDVAEATAFIEWLADGNFTFLGVRDYDYVGKARDATLERSDAPGLGVLADPDVRVLRRGGQGFTTTPAIREFLKRPGPLIITKSNLKSRVHRRAYADYIGVKHYRGGALSGETRFIGLFTSTAYSRSVRSIPYLRRKVANILARAGFDPDSHSGKALVNVLEFYPRDDLFQIDEDLLFDFAMAIMALDERPRVRVLARRDRYDRFVSVIVYMPRDRYDSTVRARIGDYLAEVYDGHVSAFDPSLPEGKLARVHFIIGRSDATATPDPFQADLERQVSAIVRTWEDEFARLLEEGFEADATERLQQRYASAFPQSYRDEYGPGAALADIGAIESLTADNTLAIDFYRLPSFTPSTVGLKLIHLGGPIALSERVPMLEHMGFRVIDERTYDLAPSGVASPISLHDMTLETDSGEAIDLDALDTKLTACLLAVCDDRAESDRYNALVIRAGLAWRDIALLRSVSRYLQQAGIAYQQDYLAAALNRNGTLAARLVALFHARFAPSGTGGAAGEDILREIEAGLEAVQSLDEDQIIRRFANVVGAMVRTNFFQPDEDGEPRIEISFKLDSAKVDGLPAPKPFREIFVHSPRVEGIHLRFGKVARGGIRWSDRPQDFRTEILGLVKAQQVKNAVIVPVGAKGGFVPKRLPVAGGRDAVMQEGIAAYSIFISSLLDITDNLDEEAVIPPAAVIRHEEDDPYLVVAADKGTATFSDIANGISTGHGFWLDDAFASGGSAGYDHKKMGITARGAWEAVKRHFREMDRDIQTEPFTVVGVGDMSGDVFGNGMLLSPATKLVAAFDHRDIFIDPDPDPAVGLAERQRLFDLPRSSWQDYDKTKISKGGGVFSRKDKAIPLSREIKALLDLTGDKATPRDVMRAILLARADLLWFGGIGTYVRGTDETDLAVGDRANDSLRVTAASLRVPVVGEGANLGMTPKARIELGLAGGRCNTDAIDNSAGVNTSDVEVNIKIALSRATRSGRLSLPKRNTLLASMTEEVAALVLRNNYLQTLALSVAEARGFEDFGYQLRLMQSLEARGLLDRAVETLPDDAAMAARKAAGKPLTRAEIAGLLAYAKIVLSDDLLLCEIFEDPIIAAELIRYFPKKMQKPHAEDIERHRLRREIIATVLANAMINHGGPTFIVRLGEGKGSNPADIALGFVAAREIFGLSALHAEIEGLDNKIPGKVQLELYRTLQDVLIARTAWFARNADFSAGVGPVIEAHAEGVKALDRVFAKVVPADMTARNEARAAAYAASGVPQKLAKRLAALPDLSDATDILAAAKESGASLEVAAQSYYAAADQFQIAKLEALAHALQTEDYYDELALDGALQVLAEAHKRIVLRMIAADGSFAATGMQKQTTDRIMRRLSTLTEAEGLSVSRVIVAADLLADLAKA